MIRRAMVPALFLGGLMGLGSAGAQSATQEYCSVVKQGNGFNLSLESRPYIMGVLATDQVMKATFNIPLDGGPDGTLNDSVSYGGTTIPYGSQDLYYYGNGFEYKGDLNAGTYTQDGVTNLYSTGSYTWSGVEAGKAQIVYIRVQAREAGIFGIGRGARMELTYQGVTYARFDTRPNTYNYAPTITALNGASLRGRNGEAVPTLVTTLTNTGPFWEYFVVLPAGMTGIGDLKLNFSDIAPLDGSRATANTDDIFFTVPRVYGGGLCLQERDTVANQTYQINGSNADNLNHTITVTQANTNMPADPTFKTVIDEAVPISVGSTNTTTPNSRVTSLQCTKSSSLPTALRAEFTDPVVINTQVVPTAGSTFQFNVSGLDVGVIADCLISNDSSQKYPTVTLNKSVPIRANAADQFSITAASTVPGNTNTAQTSGTGTSAQTVLTVRPTYTSTPVAGGTRLTENALPGSVTISESALNGANFSAYQTTLNCTRTSGTVTGLPTNQNATSYTLSGLTYNDAVSCTYLNAVAPRTTVTVTKTGQTVVMAGTAVTYTIRATMPSTETSSVGVALIDRITPLLLPAGTVVTPGNGGTYDAATGTVSWAIASIAPGSTVERTVTIDIPDPVRADDGSDSFSGPNQVSNTASVQTYAVNGDGTQGAAINNLGTPTSANVTTNHLFASVRKTVRNVTKARPAGVSASAEPGDILEYCLNYTNQSAVPLNTLRLSDALVTTQTLVTNAYGTLPLSLTRAGGTATPVANDGPGAGGAAVSKVLSNVAAGETGSLCFRAQVNAPANR